MSKLWLDYLVYKIVELDWFDDILFTAVKTNQEHILLILGKLSNQKSNKTWELVPSGDDPPPLAGLGLF